MKTINENLASAFDFTAEDIKTNAGHAVSQKQNQLLEKIIKIQKVGYIMSSILMLGSFIAIGYALMTGVGGQSIATQPEALTTVSIAGIVVFCLVGGGMYFAYGRAGDVRNKKVSVVEGTAETWSKQVGNMPNLPYSTAYYVKIDNVRFQVGTQEQFSAFKDGLKYRVYYVKNPPVQTVLSVEVL